MRIFISTALLVYLIILFYRRYIPVRGIQSETTNPQKFILDIRAYNETYHPVQSDMQIPYAYLKRYQKEIPHQELHVIANDRLELNLGLRFLVGKGYRVTSYEIVNAVSERRNIS